MRQPLTESGKLECVTYTDINGNVANLGIYTPYGFDAQREEPYKVVYAFPTVAVPVMRSTGSAAGA